MPPAVVIRRSFQRPPRAAARTSQIQNNAFLHGAAIEWTEVWPTQLLYTGREAVNRQKVASQ